MHRAAVEEGLPPVLVRLTAGREPKEMEVMRSRWWVCLAALVVAAATSKSAMAQTVAKVGDKMSYTFQKPLTNGQGMKSLADLRGHPVVVEFWGTH